MFAELPDKPTTTVLPTLKCPKYVGLYHRGSRKGLAAGGSRSGAG